jgi:hypothetical protein
MGLTRQAKVAHVTRRARVATVSVRTIDAVTRRVPARNRNSQSVGQSASESAHEFIGQIDIIFVRAVRVCVRATPCVPVRVCVCTCLCVPVRVCVCVCVCV